MSPGRRRCAWPQQHRLRPSPCGPCQEATCKRPVRGRPLLPLRWRRAGLHLPHPERAHRSRRSRTPRSRNPPWVVHNSRDKEADIDVGRRHREQARPCPAIVLDVKNGDAPPQLVPSASGKRTGKAVELAPGEVAEGMAAEGVAGEKDNVGEHEHAAEANAQTPSKVEGQNGVEPEEPNLDDCRVEGEPVEVVEHPRKSGLPTVPAAFWFRYGA